MLMGSVTVVALSLGSHFEVGREEKLRGALLAQAVVAPVAQSAQLTMLAVMVALSLATHGDPTREERFQGALLAERDVTPAPFGNQDQDARQLKLDQLIAAKPTWTSSAVLFAVGGSMSVTGSVLLFAAIATGNLFGPSVPLLVGALLFLPPGAVVVVIGLIVTISTGVERAIHDDRVRQLRETLRTSPPIAGQLLQGDGIVLARF